MPEPLPCQVRESGTKDRLLENIFDMASNSIMMVHMIIEEIGKAIERSDKTRYRIAVDCGIDHAVIHRIMHGGSCSVETLDKLCDYLGLEIRPIKAKRRAKKKDR